MLSISNSLSKAHNVPIENRYIHLNILIEIRENSHFGLTEYILEACLSEFDKLIKYIQFTKLRMRKGNTYIHTYIC